MITVHNKIRLLVSLSCVAGATVPAVAADWQFNPTIQAGAMSDSNLRLEPDTSKVSVAGGFLETDFEFLARGEISDFRLTPRVDATYFTGDDSDEDYVNGGASMVWDRRGQTTQNRLYADFDDSATVSGNRVSTDPGDGGLGNPDGGDSGSLALRNRMQSINLNNFFQYRISERNALEINASYLDRSFDVQVVGDDVSFVFYGGSLGWKTELNERSSLLVRGTMQWYDPEIIPGTTENLGLEGEWRYQVSERLDAYVRAGATRSSFNNTVPASDDETGFVGGAGGSWKFQTSRVFLDVTRTIDPNSSGYSVERDQIRVRLNKDFSERLEMLVAARYVTDSGPVGFSERKYLVATLGGEWRWSEIWSAVARYDYSWQDYQFEPSSASSNAVRLSVVYQPGRRRGGDQSALD